VKEVQPPDLEAILDRLPLEAEHAELRSRHHPMLPSRQLSQRNLGSAELT
jgi:hypothetical protein